MAKRKRKAQAEVENEGEVKTMKMGTFTLPPEQAQAIEESPPEAEPNEEVSPEEQAALAEVEGEVAKPNSVVLPKFKVKYLENARALGIPGKAAKRSNWDWLSQEIAAECLNDKHKIDIGSFLALLDANGVDHSKWTNRNKGWEGRLRMTGRVALQKVVANTGVLKTADGRQIETPADFVARYKTKV